MSARELLEGYSSKRFSPVEATEAAFRRIHDLNPKINAFNHLNEDAATAAAKASETRWAAGAPEGLLDGVPTSVKDLIVTIAMPTRRGSRTSDADAPCDEDAPCVARLREHNAVILGKTTTPEFGWKGLDQSPLTGNTHNPWKLGKTTGGSSAGAAAALAAGMCTLSVGSDGGGSIRIPSAFTGVFGIKMNYGRVPVWPESAMRTLSHVGPMARNVGDAALLANVMCEPDHRDWTALPYQAIDWSDGLDSGVRGWRIAYSADLGYAKVDPEIAGLVEAAAKLFEDLGAIVEAVVPGFDDPIECFQRHWFAGAAGAFGDYGEEQLALMDPGLVDVIERGMGITVRQYTDALGARGALATTMRAFHQTYDLLLTPALAVPAFDHDRIAPPDYPDDAEWTAWTPFTYPFNLTQQPACSIPCGLTAAGLPAGLQIVGRSYADDMVLAAARAYEQVAPKPDWPMI